MKVEDKGNSKVVKDTQGNLESFILKLENEFNSFNKYNLIIDLNDYKVLNIEDILKFKQFNNRIKKANKSFVLVTKNFDFDLDTDSIIVVPSILEAHDIIEMEEIERDLGF